MLTRRSLLKGTGFGLLASFFPRLVHSATGTSATGTSATGTSHPTWDDLINHVGCGFGDRRPDLMRWIHELVYRPNMPGDTLLLHDPYCKIMFVEAMKLLVPTVCIPGDMPRRTYTFRTRRGELREVVQIPSTPPQIAVWERSLEQAQLIVVNDLPDKSITIPRNVKWCLTSDYALNHYALSRLPSMQGLLSMIWFPVKYRECDEGFLDRLKAEKDAFLRTLTTYESEEDGQYHDRFSDYVQSKNARFMELYGGKAKTF